MFIKFWRAVCKLTSFLLLQIVIDAALTVAHKVYLIYSVYYIKRLHCIVFSFIRRTWHVRNLPFTISIIRINWEIEINGFIHTSCYIVFTKCASSSREMVSSSSGTS